MSGEEIAADPAGIVAADDVDLVWWRVLAEPTVVALLLATVAHVARRNVTDVLVFPGMVAVIALDRVGALGAGRRIDLPAVRARVLVAAAIGYGLLVLPLVRGGTQMRLVLALPGIAALLIVLAGRNRGGPVSAPGRGWLVWPVLLVSGCLFELANFLLQSDPMTPNHAHPVLSDIVEPWLGSGVARAVFAALWLVVGWQLLRVLVQGSEEVEQ